MTGCCSRRRNSNLSQDRSPFFKIMSTRQETWSSVTQYFCRISFLSLPVITETTSESGFWRPSSRSLSAASPILFISSCRIFDSWSVKEVYFEILYMRGYSRHYSFWPSHIYTFSFRIYVFSHLTYVYFYSYIHLTPFTYLCLIFTLFHSPLTHLYFHSYMNMFYTSHIDIFPFNLHSSFLSLRRVCSYERRTHVCEKEYSGNGSIVETQGIYNHIVLTHTNTGLVISARHTQLLLQSYPSRSFQGNYHLKIPLNLPENMDFVHIW